LGDQEGAGQAHGLGEAGESETERKREREEGRRRETVGEGGPWRVQLVRDEGRGVSD